MPLFGKRTDKKYDKDFSLAKVVKADPKKSVKSFKASKEIIAKEIALPATKQVRTIPSAIYSNIADVIIRPHITEKTGMLSQSNMYTFQVVRDVNKQTIAKAVKELYKVNPVKVAVIKVSAKNIFVRGKNGSIPGMKKVIVTLKKGEKIDFV